jgi:thiopurine S-methyltransferase
MEAEFWLQRWREGATGFHMNRVTPLLAKYWPSLQLPHDARVLVPLCGKSLDMIWLASRGHQVLGVELSPIAVEQFFTENGLTPAEYESPMGRHYVADGIEIICGDIFDIDAATLASCIGVYDRAALVALPAPMRARYAHHVYGGLGACFRGLLLTLEYEQHLMEGPPFSVTADEVQTLFDGHAGTREIDRLDIITKEPKFAERGLARLDSVTWRLDGRRA